MNPKVEAPPPRDYGQETADTLRAQMEAEAGTGRFADIGPRSALEGKYAPVYQQQQIDLLKQAAPQLLSIYKNDILPQTSELEASTLQRQRQADIDAIRTLGPQARAALDSTNPDQAKLVASLTNQAQAGLDAGSNLTPEQRRMSVQQSRASFADRGLVNSPSSIYDESLRSQLLGLGMQDQRRAAALQALGAGQSFYGDQWQQITGRPGSSLAMGSNIAGQAGGLNPGMIFNPESQYSADINNQNYQGSLAARTASASNRASILGAGIGAFGSILGKSFGSKGLFGG